MSTLGSATSSAYEPYVLADDGPSIFLMKLAARSADEDDETATISCRTSFTSRVAGSVRRSLQKAAFVSRRVARSAGN